MKLAHPPQQHRPPQSAPPQSAFPNLQVRFCLKNRCNSLLQDSTIPDRITLRVFQHVGFGTKGLRRFANRRFKGQMLKRMQRVVVNENTDRTMRRKQVRELPENPIFSTLRSVCFRPSAPPPSQSFDQQADLKRTQKFVSAK